MSEIQNMPLVSIIINCFNGEQFLRETIESVINQTYPNWEMIFWDNQSTDSTADIVNSYEDSRIRYIYASEHTSLGKARSLAIKEARGEYISFLDSDDMWYKDFLESFVLVFQENKNINLIYSRFVNYYSKNCNKVLSHGGNHSQIIPTNVFVRDYNVAMSASMINCNVLKKLNDKYFNSNYSLIEDYDFFIRIASISEIYYIEKPLAIYRIHSNNNSYSDKWVSEFISLRNSIISKESGYEGLLDYLYLIDKKINYYQLVAESAKCNRFNLICSTLKGIVNGKIALKHLLIPLLGTKNYFKLQIKINKML